MSNFSNGVINGSNTPVIYQTTDANRPTAPLAVGSLFVSQTSNILQRWDGSGWVTVGGSGTGSVTSVNGQTGVVVLTTTDIAEGTNLYYTDARARAALSAGSGISYNSTTGAITNGGVLSFNGSTGAITYTAPVTSVNSQTGAVTLTTTNIAEGTNLYYTDARARAALSAGSGISYNQTTGQITNSGVLSVNGQTGTVTITSAVTSVNGQTGVVVLTTTDIAEGTNLYYTDARARAALSAGSGISYNSTTGAITNSGVLSFNGSTGAITYTAPVTSVNSQTGAVVLTTTNIAEGTNLYYTDGRARSALSGGTGVTYNSTTGVIAIGQSVATSGTPVFAGVQANGSSGLLINNSAGTLVATFGSAGTTNASIVGGLNVGGAGVFSSDITMRGGDFYFENTLGTDTIAVIESISNTALILSAVQNIPILIKTNNTERIRITNAGNVGIGISNPSALLDVAGNVVFRNQLLFDDNGTAVLSAQGSLSTNFIINSRNTLTFQTGQAYGSSTTRLTIDSVGAAVFSSTVQATQFNGVLASGNSLAGTLTGTGTNVGAQWKFVSDNNTTGAFIGIAAGESTGDAVFAVGANKKLVFGIGSSGTSRAVEIDANSVKIFETAGNTSNWVSLGAVGTGTNTWLFGAATTGSGYTLKTDAYLNITHNGTAYKLALIN